MRCAELWRRKLTEVSASVSRRTSLLQRTKVYPPKRLIRAQGPLLSPTRARDAGPGRAAYPQLNEHLWMGKYSPKWPDGKKHSRSVYASTSKECEEKLAKLIQQMKLEIAETKRFAAEGKWEQVMALAGQKKARGARGIESGHQEKTTTVQS